MSDFYGDAQRQLQDRFGSRALADRLTELIIHDEVQDDERGFIESRDMFFLASVGADGQPSCSYKGGAPGFVRVVDTRTLAFPSYDGNGMFLSTGNIRASAKIGLLFIDFETPHRLRVHGEASIADDDPLKAHYPGAELVVRLAISSIFVNCPRYIHRHQKIAPSKYVPQAACEAPLAQWKRIDLVQDVLPAQDVARVPAAGGVIDFGNYLGKVAAGDG
ncbi:pyridoxamine 5'-phosphate oxidase [Methylibium sp. Pch-M]|jgi:predicted pyridoxine 5'-phosphate oxidase superfamily flavin-nucleotide-binding protein|uniref:pyridoxamine 5'-phosphate oxidase family protein n=1 Tax=Methylibium TaxID=316612 RepID=UPI00101352EC|nr:MULTISPECIES: pyridoxamine 5'-phosphate oxidase family protein [Methylibium]MBN9204700.1 pyridoxamine 5'-phosphate oxidase family protein [Methylibium petroleiphilum]QAZ38824.1 pyridoxamine 5'-phosphate oxidase [Methylibium sp. Pch-M]